MTEYSIRVNDVSKSFETSRKIGILKEKKSRQSITFQWILKKAK